ncbi:DUF962 domain-containing protein [Pedobacter sp. SYP-B3415]|uniref:DUF962 domain-containing protein n=1 Tax=Pedobacter sp. SYP-B3415 TaxID=2496641 RepID=UPI00101C5C87|nr:DUF962 domain-containing protein [Pedobacter sp. SYP-B3415]
MTKKKYRSLQEFYPFYLTEHANSTSRILHFTGTALLLMSAFAGFLFHDWRFFVAVPVLGYGFAWVGHYFFEKNKPATFQYPLYSLASDFILFYDLLTGKQPFHTGKEKP